MPISLPSSPGTRGDVLLPPIANPESFTIPLGNPEIVLDIFDNDNLRGELPEDVGIIIDHTGLEGVVTVHEGDSTVTYIPPVGGTARQDFFDYRIVGVGGSSNTVTVTINLVVAVPPVYEAGVYEPGVYQ